ncbi:MAG: hypothetical protein Phyf2KO_23010 [Phycisphaerales bacterium]
MTDAKTLIARWPKGTPLTACIAGDPSGRSRYSLFAQPEELRSARTLAELDKLITHETRCCIQSGSQFGPGWVVSIDYMVGREIEPTTAGDGCIQSKAPAITAARIGSGYIHDNRTGEITEFGSPPRLCREPIEPDRYTIGTAQGLDRQSAYMDAVRRVVELIRAGDAFQVNLAHRLSAAFSGSARAFAANLIDTLKPWHGCYIELPSNTDSPIGAIASLSPELFLELTSDGNVRTRPMKGTRSGSTPPGELDLSPKDNAELAMIVDLMRNDLGRVCEFGSVRVTDERSIEPHGGSADSPSLWQGVATIEGSLRKGMSTIDLLRAAFPPGSVTGAPKVRAMQIIEELEPSLGFDQTMPARGPYCGACGFIGDDGSASLNVSIRTAIFTGFSNGAGTLAEGKVHYPVGAGIVADSEPHAEWCETLDKARPFLDLCGSGCEDVVLGTEH